jgi:O-acetyl-ADP-ribose deacetylase (regulator of RNase III)
MVNVDWWSDNDSSKRQIMAELLIPNSVQPEAIRSCCIPHGTTIPQHETSFTIISNPHMFFQNSLVARVTPYISLMSGDMFFSNMSTMTVAVNSIGVMGKGLAATCKYRFPDAYVRYQDLCRTSKLQLGQCALYKRNRDLDADLSYDPLLLSHVNSKKWFLFFPTKNDWRHNSTLEGIEQGMQWLLSNYKKEGITSIALPALGCGLGKLKWEDVGPVMCKYLNQMNIQCEIFLPLEQNTNLDPKSLTAVYLIRS